MRQAGRTIMSLIAATLLAACSAVPAPSAGRAQASYIVERGDSLSQIAMRMGVSTTALIRENNLRTPYTIHPGQRLRLPQTGRTTTANPRPARNLSQMAPPPRPAATATPAPATSPAARALSSQTREASQTREIGAPNFAWPADAPVAAKFGAVVDGRARDGLDLSVLPGQRILSAGSGTVLFAGMEPMYGQLVIVDHGGGWVTAYGFVGQITVREGDAVTFRERIGVNGTKNRKLHFQLRKDNEPRDPQVYLPPRF